MKQTTQVKPTGVRVRALLEVRNEMICNLYAEDTLTKSDISFIFNLSLQLINSILKRNINIIKSNFKKHDKHK